MWFKQAAIFQLQTTTHYTAEKLIQQLTPLVFSPCLPSLPSSHGWAPPVDEEEAPLVCVANNNLMFCLQLEEKILPATVVRQVLQEKVKGIEAIRDRKVSAKEKYLLKDEILHTLLPRAFSKLSRVYAYIDIQNQWLVIDTTLAAKIEKFTELLQRSAPDIILQPIINERINHRLTHWLINQDYPDSIGIEKACLLGNPLQKSSTIRCQQQDLFSHGVQTFVKDGYEVKQLALSWQDRVNFILTEEFTLRSIQFLEDVTTQASDLEPETKLQKFNVDFLIMAGTFAGLLQDLLGLVVQKEAA
jgi:recombination associated protein RdgC